MASNRKLPFGYRMELGKVVVHQEEASAVQYIFQQYIRQLVDTVRVISAGEIVVYLQGGMEITQKITG